MLHRGLRGIVRGIPLTIWPVAAEVKASGSQRHLAVSQVNLSFRALLRLMRFLARSYASQKPPALTPPLPKLSLASTSHDRPRRRGCIDLQAEDYLSCEKSFCCECGGTHVSA